MLTPFSGYMAPEYLYRGEISTELDIYSLGLLIIEITTGERNQRSSQDMPARNFVENVSRVINNTTLDDFRWKVLFYFILYNTS
jgi:serine/threonine protein kinase